jgi:hypothetical protein
LRGAAGEVVIEDSVKNTLTMARFTGNIEIREHPPEGQADVHGLYCSGCLGARYLDTIDFNHGN